MKPLVLIAAIVCIASLVSFSVGARFAVHQVLSANSAGEAIVSVSYLGSKGWGR